MTDALELFFDRASTGAILYRPVRDEAGAVVDFTFHRLNPAAQRLLGLPAQPAGTYLETFPGVESAENFTRQQTAFLHDAPAEWEDGYPRWPRLPLPHLGMPGRQVGSTSICTGNLICPKRPRPVRGSLTWTHAYHWNGGTRPRNSCTKLLTKAINQDTKENTALFTNQAFAAKAQLH